MSGTSLNPARPSFLKRLGWLVLIWTLSVLALGIVATLLHVLMNVAGLTR